MEAVKAAKDDYPVLLDVWERSVKATHDFLTDADFLAIKQEVPAYFPSLSLLMWYDEGQLLGFSGASRDKLEMLFLEPELTGKGYGTKILKSLIKVCSLSKVDVNEQNHNGKAFYLKNGFQIVDRSEVDGQGRNYPLLHLALPKTQKK